MEERPCVSGIEDPEVLSLGLLPEAAGGTQRGCERSMTVVMRSRSAVGTTMPGAHRGPDTAPSTLPTATRRGHSTAPPPTFYGKAHTEGLSSLPVKNSYSPFKALPGHPCPDPLAEDLHPPLHPSESHLSCLRVCAHPLSPVLKGSESLVHPCIWQRQGVQMRLPNGTTGAVAPVLAPSGPPPRRPGGLPGTLGWLLPQLILPGSWGRGRRRGVPALRDGGRCGRRGHRARGRGAPCGGQA